MTDKPTAAALEAAREWGTGDGLETGPDWIGSLALAFDAFATQPSADGLADEIVRNVAELPDRTSPDDWPEAMLVTADELQEIVNAAISASSVLRTRQPAATVERVARALLAVEESWNDHEWEQLPEGVQAEFRKQAQAAITAMTEER